MFRPMPLLVASALALVALGGYDVLRDGRGPAATAGPQPASVTEPATLAVTRLPLGEVVTSAGATLYRFDKDTGRPARSTCIGQCALTWPPVQSSGGPPTLDGVNSALVGIVVRPDGTEQLTLGGWPLYRYGGDTAPGETRGEGMGGTWHAIGPTGKPAVAAKPAGPSTSTSARTGPTPRPAPAPSPAAPAPSDGGGETGGDGY
jgi:predicted lipoprotein with Yx(FWY)xxD motif